MDTLAAGTKKTYYLPFISTLWDSADLAYQFQHGDIHIEMLTRDCKVSGSGTITCNDISVVIQSDLPDAIDSAQERRLAESVILATKIADPMIASFPNVNLQASSITKLKLDNITGDISHLLVLIKDTSVTNASNGLATYKSLGPRGTVDLLTPSSQSILGQGTAIPLQILEDLILPGSFDNDFIRCTNAIIIPFTKNVRDAMSGDQGQGYYHMSAQAASPQLALQPDAAGTAEVQSLVTDSTAAGKYQLGFRGEFTGVLAHTASVGAVKAALEALSSFKNARGVPMTVTVNSTLAASATTTFTIVGDEELDDSDVISFHTAHGDANSGTTTRTTRMKPGWFATSGASNVYNVTVYGYQFKNVTVSDGSLRITDV